MLPIRTSIRPIRTPYMNYSLIAVNVVLFFLTYKGRDLMPWARMFMLTPIHPFLWQFITYAFLHGSLMHIFGNMYFLYIFGNNVSFFREPAEDFAAELFDVRLFRIADQYDFFLFHDIPVI